MGLRMLKSHIHPQEATRAWADAVYARLRGRGYDNFPRWGRDPVDVVSRGATT